ncbi:MAG TPA: 50S ribosomal protein L28 [Myxococcales bacterium]|nr:50S ribosomal protein L28 [Myxococcales bacterium]HIN86802.1 50S ribosomal protein L28 [Myxococcales bacterium]
MAKCQLTGKRRLVGNNVSHAHNKTKRVQKPNVQRKRIWVPEEQTFIRIKLSTRALRTVTKVGLYAYIRKNDLTFKQFGLSGPARV